MLGVLPVTNGAVHFLYKGDGQHTNLLATKSQLLVTVQDASSPPDTPTPDRTAWLYSASLSQTPASGQTYSLLDHLRHLLTDDPDLQTLHISGGLNVWSYRNTQKLTYWAKTAMDAWNRGDFDTVHKRLVETLDFLDGSKFVQNDVPPGTALLADAHAAQVGLLQLHDNQQPPGYLYHVALHLNGVLGSPGSTKDQQTLANQVYKDLNIAKNEMEQLRQDALQLVVMNTTQLALASSQTVLSDMMTQANMAFTGTNSDTTQPQDAKGGITVVYQDVQKLAAFGVQRYTP